MNPNGGLGSDSIDASSPPPRHGGVDPTIALFDGEGSFAGIASGGTPKPSIAPIDYVRGYEPPSPQGPPGQGGNPNTGHAKR